MRKFQLIFMISLSIVVLAASALGISIYLQSQQNIDPEGSKAAVLCVDDSECNGGRCVGGYCQSSSAITGQLSLSSTNCIGQIDKYKALRDITITATTTTSSANLELYISKLNPQATALDFQSCEDVSIYGDTGIITPNRTYCKINGTTNTGRLTFNWRPSSAGKYVIVVNSVANDALKCSGNILCSFNAGSDHSIQNPTDCAGWQSCSSKDYAIVDVVEEDACLHYCHTDAECKVDEKCNLNSGDCETFMCTATDAGECKQRADHSCDFVNVADGTACSNNRTCLNGVCNSTSDTNNCLPALTVPANNAIIVNENPTFTWTACTQIQNPKYQLIVKKGDIEVQKVITTAVTQYKFLDYTSHDVVWENNGVYTWTVKVCPTDNSDCVGGIPTNSNTFTYKVSGNATPTPTVTPTPTPTLAPTPTPTVTSTPTPTTGKTRSNCQGDSSVCYTNEICNTNVSPNVCSSNVALCSQIPNGKTANCLNISITDKTCKYDNKPDGTACGQTGQTCQTGACSNPPSTNYTTIKGLNISIKLGNRPTRNNYTYPTMFAGVWRDTTPKMLESKVPGLINNTTYTEANFFANNTSSTPTGNAYSLQGDDYLIIKPESYLSKAYKISTLTIQNNTLILTDTTPYLGGDTIIDTGTFDNINVRDYVFFRDFYGRDNTYDYYYIDYNGNGTITIHDAVEYRNNLGKTGATRNLNSQIINAIQTVMEGSLYKVISL